jgi:disulfide bond formation protein DsbB
MVISRIRVALLLCAVASLAALGVALGSEWYGGLVPCALCLVERWPYRIAAVLALLGILAPPRYGRWVLVICALVLLGAVASGFVHVGVEFGWWPSPLPECMAPNLSGMSMAERLAHMPAKPSKPCDEPTYLIAWLPMSMAEMNVIYALVLAGCIAIFTGTRKGADA